MKTIGEVIEKYQGKEPGRGRNVPYSCKISGAARIKIGCLAEHMGTKKTRLAGELLEAAINEAFEQIEDEFDPGLLRAYEEEMAEYEEEQSHQ